MGDARAIDSGEAAGARQALFGPYVLAPEQRLLTRQGVPVAIGARALEVLIALVGEHGRVLTHRQLIERAWAGLTVEESNLRVAVSGLRKTLREGEEGARYIENVVGRGYCFVAPVRWLNLPPEHVQPSAAPPAAHNLSTRLPLPAARVIGRDVVVDRLVTTLGERSLISLVGAGGLGKTTVAALVAQALKARAAVEPVFVDLSAADDEAALIKAVAAALGLDGPGRELEETVITALAGHRLLLVLDGCEHLVEAVATFCDRLTRRLDAYRILVTSREALRVEAETVHLLDPLDFPHADDADAAGEPLDYSAVQLFVERAEVSGRRGPWTQAETRLAGDICRRLDGLALAIELVASRVGALGLRGVVDLLDESLGLQWPGRRDAAPRHQTLQALLDWSHDLLNARDQRVLRRLALFTGPFGLKDAHAVAGDPGDDALEVANALTSLVDKSLVWTSHGGAGPVQFRLLDTTRAYALAKLTRSGEAATIAERHARQVLARLQEGGGSDGSLFQRRAPSAPPTVGDVLAALRWAEAASPDDLFSSLAIGAAPLMLSRALLEDCETWCVRALNRLAEGRRGGGEELRLLEAIAIARMFGRGNHDAVRETIERGLSLAERLKARADQVQLLAGQHIFLTRIGEFSAALDCGRQCAELCDAARDPGGAALAQWMLGTSLHLVADQRRAQEAIDQGFAYWAAADTDGADVFGYDHKVRAMIVLCRALWLRGERARSIEVCEAAVVEAERGGRPVSLCIALIYTATVALWDEDWETADRLVVRLIEHSARHGIGPYHGVGLALAGELDIGRGRYAKGVEGLGQALERLDREAHRILSPAFSGTLAQGLHALGEHAKARRRILAALKDARAIGQHYDLPRLYLIASEVLAGDGEDVRRDYAWQALEAARAGAALSLELAAAMALLSCDAAKTPGEAQDRVRQLLAAMPDRDGPLARRAADMLSKLA
ncbi:winged helix-turn-helix domain-containing protein [Caulobacter sp. CCH9-E1]|uniref:ATP-binding protein n=1 Tax=Caulobacter sp. CCH9-E1 TaxID=1768768 RepID=UPI000829B2F2|nr:winged helix-turn-helix domain-containing protein [Caulobacter sp. CCH9-E1]